MTYLLDRAVVRREVHVHDRMLITSRENTPEGYLKVGARIARVGIQKYRAIELGITDASPLQTVTVYRPPDEVFSDEALSSFAGKPVTIDHPTELVTADNYKNLAVGFAMENVWRDGDYVRVNLVITDKEAIRLITNGLVELSAGYTLTLDPTPGTVVDGTAYDVVQRNIRGNHIALVDAGRCGGECRLDDHAVCDDPSDCDCASCNKRRLYPMDKDKLLNTVTFDGMTVHVADDVKVLIDRITTKYENTLKNLEDTQRQMFSAHDKHAKELKDRDDKISALEHKLTPAALADMADDRFELLTRAMDFLSDDYETKGKTNGQIARDAVTAVYGADKLRNKDDTYVLAMFDTMTLEQVNDKGFGNATQPRLRAADKNDTGNDTYRQRIANAWKGEQDRAN